MGHSVVFQYTYTMYNEQMKVIGIFITWDVKHYFVLGIFNIFSISYFQIFNCGQAALSVWYRFLEIIPSI